MNQLLKKQMNAECKFSKLILIHMFTSVIFSLFIFFKGGSSNIGPSGQKGEAGYPGPYVSYLEFYTLLMYCVNLIKLT